MAKLHYTWSQIESDYRHLWNHWYEDDAEEVLKDIQLHVREASQLGIMSQLGITDAPYDENLVKKWRMFVHRQYRITQV